MKVTLRVTLVFIGCEVHPYDPTVNLSNQNVIFSFYNHSWLSSDTDTSINSKTLSRNIDANGQRNITMLKLYVEVSDIKGLDAWVAQGSLDNVYQIAVERHFLGGK